MVKYVEDENMSKENYIVINGKRAELTEEQLRQLGIESREPKRWKGVRGNKYYWVDNIFQIEWDYVEQFGCKNAKEGLWIGNYL